MHEAHHVWFICDGHHKRPHPQAVVHVIRVPHRTGVLPAVRCDNAVRVTGAGGMQVLQSGVRFELHHIFWHSRSRGASSTLVDSSRRAAAALEFTVGMQACKVLVDTRIIEVCYDAMSSFRYAAATVVPPSIHKNARTRTACAFRASCRRQRYLFFFLSLFFFGFHR